MPQPSRRTYLVSILILAGLPALPGRALGQEPAPASGVVHVLGLPDIKRNAHGKLSVGAGTLGFVAGTAKAAVPIAAVQDVFTGEDSKRMVGGAVGTISMFAPYGGGRFLSLFRKKVDVLTVEYRDPAGGLHGVIFSLPPGQAVLVKKQLVAQGAHASIPVEEEIEQQKADKKKKGERKP